MIASKVLPRDVEDMDAPDDCIFKWKMREIIVKPLNHDRQPDKKHYRCSRL